MTTDDALKRKGVGHGTPGGARLKGDHGIGGVLRGGQWNCERVCISSRRESRERWRERKARVRAKQVHSFAATGNVLGEKRV